MTTDRMPRGPGLFRMRTGDGPPLVTNIRRLAGTDREPGSVLVTAGMALLALLDAGLLYVVFAAQDRFIFTRQAPERGVHDPGPRPGRGHDHFLGARARPGPQGPARPMWSAR